MINSNGENIYTNSEIAYELGISPATVNAVAKRIYGGGKIPHWTLNQARVIVEYVKSISVEEDAKRLAALHNVVLEVFGGNIPDGTETEAQIKKDKGVVA